MEGQAFVYRLTLFGGVNPRWLSISSQPINFEGSKEGLEECAAVDFRIVVPALDRDIIWYHEIDL